MGTSSLVPLDGGLPDESRAFAETLRSLFVGLEVSVRRYAARRNRDAGSISRFLNGTRIPTWEFVHDLLSDVAEQQGSAPTPETTELLRRLHRTALDKSGSAHHRVQVLEDQLADADRETVHSKALVRALENALVDAQHRAADLERQMGQLRVYEERKAAETDRALQVYEDQLAGLRRERQSLVDQVDALGEQLKDAHGRRIQAEQRCEELERQLVAAEEEYEREDVPTPANATLSVSDGEASAEQLNPHHLFETFAVSDSNRFPYAAAVAVAGQLANRYNPLTLHGGSAMGKTHLLHAVGNRARVLQPGLRVRYVTSEGFAYEFEHAHLADRLEEFRRGYRDVDLLLLDDLQFLPPAKGEGAAQDEFLRIFNALHSTGRQIVLASDRPPGQLQFLDSRLRNRIESSLVTEIQPPALQTRIAILRQLADRDGVRLPREVLELIATKVERNTRELEGALVRVTAFASLNRQPVDLALTEAIMNNLVPDRGPVRGEEVGHLILRETAAYFGLTSEDLCGTFRGRALVTARQIAMYLCHELTDLSVSEIGSLFGGREHTAAEHAYTKIRSLMSQRRSVYNQIAELTIRVKAAVDSPA
ncbi:chromosomal replication initiator protein DnaA [Streptomyces sp. NRRL WC-3618]|uniref:chromosomal replication initiator protein DnaA n=1 Tax=Streptomyces sp. NRRL WC-3618 TaxID=1519490 RepID=UPI0006AFD31D|nr:chromosomal replication initiator protein DnaA [Streptomyces sp. NRRL WC-3618]